MIFKETFITGQLNTIIKGFKNITIVNKIVGNIFIVHL